MELVCAEWHLGLPSDVVDGTLGPDEGGNEKTPKANVDRNVEQEGLASRLSAEQLVHQDPSAVSRASLPSTLQQKNEI